MTSFFSFVPCFAAPGDVESRVFTWLAAGSRVSLKDFFHRITGSSRVVEATSDELQRESEDRGGSFGLGPFTFPGDRPLEAFAPVVESPEARAEALRQERGGLRVASRDVGLCLVPSLGERALVYRLGAGLRSAEQPDLAIDLWRASLELQPDDAMGWFYLGQLLLQRGERTEAEDAFMNARQCDPQNGIAVGMIAYIATLREDWTTAVRLYQDAVSLCPQNPQLLQSLAISQSNAGLESDAIITKRRLAALM